MKKLSKHDLDVKINKEIDHLDEYVALGVLSRAELTDKICRRHLLSAKHAIAYFLKNTHQTIEDAMQNVLKQKKLCQIGSSIQSK